MKRVCFLVAACVLGGASILAQEPASKPLDAPTYENGTLANNSYSNECFGFSMPIPDGWQANTTASSVRAKHLPGGGIALLAVHQTQEGAFGKTIILTARDTSGSAPTLQGFVSGTVHSQVDADKEHRALVRDAFPVDYAGQHFFRADYKLTVNGAQLYSAYAYTKFRGYYIGATLVSGSAEGLEESAKALQTISFREDTPNPKCVMQGDDNSTGVIGGIISSKPPVSPGVPQRVRVSAAVSQGLLINKVAPHYPEDARHDHIQGQVVLHATISKDGDIEDLQLISGHPALAPAAMEAVKQWKYKPYLLNGEPAEVETQIVVNFTLSGG